MSTALKHVKRYTAPVCSECLLLSSVHMGGYMHGYLSVRLKSVEHDKGFGPVFMSYYYDALISSTPPQMCCIISQGCFVAARASAVSFRVPACLQLILRHSWLLSSVISLCQICTPASANHSLVSTSTPRTHHQYDPSPGLQGAAPPLLIVLKPECF